MTTQQKQKLNWWLELIPKGVTPILLISLIWQGGTWHTSIIRDIREKGFDSPEQKLEHKLHVQAGRTELEDYITKIKTDSTLKALNMELAEKKEIKEKTNENYEEIRKLQKQLHKVEQSQQIVLNKIEQILLKTK